jgi:dTDP-4-amino-4,6-dideoxygalactose transaminase
MPPYAEPPQSFPIAERMAASGINLPTHARLVESDIERVAAGIRAFAMSHAQLNPT